MKRDIETIRYHQYVVQYNRAKRQLEARGETMFTKKLSKEDFLTRHEYERADKRFKGSLTKRIVETQKYKVDYKSSLNFYKLNKEMGKDISFKEIRQGRFDRRNTATEFKSQLLAQGYSEKEARRIVSRDLFGSP